MSTFKQLGVKKEFIKGLKDLDINTPSEIQAEVIPLLLNDDIDLIGQAQTGTGKTAAFGLPLLHKIDPSLNQVQALVLCPTRELGQQVAKQLFKYTKYSEKIFTESVYGGEKIERQISRLKRPTHIVVATPGRLLDLVRRKDVDIRNVKTVVLDEADEMLSMGFKKQLDEILTLVPNNINKWLFSATMPQGIQDIIKNHLSPGATRIEVSKTNVVNENIEHQYLVCADEDKFEVFIQFIRSIGKERGVIFCKTKVATQKLTKQLIARNVPTDCIHGDLKQIERDKVMRAFKNEKLQLLVATDLAARGIDIDSLSFVAHYQLPDKEEFYTHRSGRTARAGKEGISIAFIAPFEAKQIRHYEKNLSIKFKEIKRV